MKLSTWAELAGILALVVSLVFVGMELRLSSSATSAQALLELSLATNELVMWDLENYSQELDRKATEEPWKLSVEEERRVRLVSQMGMNLQERTLYLTGRY